MVKQEMDREASKQHFILVHGTCRGAWCWYKLATLLRSVGHGVTALDLGASGVNPKKLNELRSFADYYEPLMEAMAAIPPEKKVVLVGHSFDGLCMALAMQEFPEKISVAVFANAIMPSPTTPISIVGQEYLRRHPPEYFLDSIVTSRHDLESHSNAIIFGPDYMSERMYQLCPPEDLTLATMLIRPSSCFENDADGKIMVSKEKYGSVQRVYVVGKEDLSIKEDYQQWMIEQSPKIGIEEIEGLIIWLCSQRPMNYVKSSWIFVRMAIESPCLCYEWRSSWPVYLYALGRT